MKKIGSCSCELVELNEVEMMSIDGGVSDKVKRGLHKIVDGIKDIVDWCIDQL
jgi:hypothetical protein